MFTVSLRHEQIFASLFKYSVHCSILCLFGLAGPASARASVPPVVSSQIPPGIVGVAKTGGVTAG